MTSQPQPGPKPAKSRLLQDGRDMFWSIVPLIVACLALAGMLGMCSFQPAGPGQGPIPEYDAPAALQADADTLNIPVRLPQLPEGWQPNSGGRDSIEGGVTDPQTGAQTRAVVSRVGYIAPSGMYLSLTQSNADETRLVNLISPGMAPTGTEDVGNITWVIYEGGERGEPIWTARLAGPTGPAQIALTGAGGTDDFRTLAEATQSQEPLTAR